MIPQRFIFFLLTLWGYSFSVYTKYTDAKDGSSFWAINPPTCNPTFSSDYQKFLQTNCTLSWCSGGNANCAKILSTTEENSFINVQPYLSAQSAQCCYLPEGAFDCGWNPNEHPQGSSIPFGEATTICATGKKPTSDLANNSSHIGSVGQCGEKCEPCDFSNPNDLVNKYCINCSSGYAPSSVEGSCASLKSQKEQECTSQGLVHSGAWDCVELTDPASADCKKISNPVQGTCISSSSSSSSDGGTSAGGTSAGGFSSGGTSSARSSSSSFSSSSSSECFGFGCSSSSSTSGLDLTQTNQKLDKANGFLESIDQSLKNIASYFGVGSSSSSTLPDPKFAEFQTTGGSGSLNSASDIEALKSSSGSIQEVETMGSGITSASASQFDYHFSMYGKDYTIGLSSTIYEGRNVFEWLGTIILVLVPFSAFMGLRSGLRAGSK